MNEQLSLLIQLQEIDEKIRACRGEKERAPARLAQLDERAQAARANLDNARQALEDAQKAKRERDGDLEAGAGKVEKLKSRTSEIKTNKEYTALLKEIETAEQENKVIEEDILKLMEKIDASSAEIGAAEKHTAEEAKAIEAERAELEASLVKLTEELEAEEQARSELAGKVEADVFAEYTRLVPMTNGRIVVEARNEACTGCYMSIPPRTFVSVKKNEQIIGCPNCHRILYYKETIAPAAS